MSKIVRSLALVAIGLLGSQQLPAFAQEYPTRPIIAVVPFSAGGPSDVVTRLVTDHMSRTLGQQIVIENALGAGGTLGSARVASAQPDGYTLLAGSMGSHVAAPVLYSNLKYSPLTDFTPVGLMAHAPAMIVARKDFPAKDMAEFIAYVRKEGASIKQAHGGVGASSHMACLLFNSQLGLHPSSVAYRGTGPAVNDILGGHVDYLCEQVLSVAEHVNSGAMKAYAVSSTERVPVAQDVPTATEAGVNEYQMSIWNGIFAPKGTPKPIIDKLAAALDKALEDPVVRKRLSDLGGTLPNKEERTSEGLAKLVKAESARWEPVLKAAKAASQ